MRVSTDNLSNPNKLNVIRGVFSTETSDHSDNTIIRKIRPIPVEFRRPSIIRASGHTFEYLGYGPETIQPDFLKYKQDPLQKKRNSWYSHKKDPPVLLSILV